MERNVLVAVVLSMLVLVLYQNYLVPPVPVDTEGVSQPVESMPLAGSETGNNAAATTPTPLTTAPSETTDSQGDSPRLTEGEPESVPPGITALIAAEIEETTTVESDAILATFSNRGGVLTSWKLKNHTEPESDALIELVPTNLPPEQAQPFTLAFDNPELSARARTALFEASSTALSLEDAPEEVSFVYEDSSGLRITKTYSFDPNEHDYVMSVSVVATLNSENVPFAIQWGPALGGGESTTSSMIGYRYGPRAVVYGRVETDGVLGESDINHLEVSDIQARAQYHGQLRYVGIDNHYFLAAAITSNPSVIAGYQSLPLPPLNPDGPSRELITFELRWPDNVVESEQFFLGPKDFARLERVDPALIEAIDFGWTSWIVVPLHRSLSQIYGYVGNWGWAIIILTFLINLILFPLRHKSVISMRKLAEAGPEIKAIQARYADVKTTDPKKQKMNQEVMELYKKRGVNPVSGCFPMLLTMPVLFAFYSLLSVAVEIRGEPFMGWITDLTVADPLYITPIAMGASMVIQQRMTPTPSQDPMQQKMMMLMPIMFSVMFLFAASGLVLYWLTSNVLTIAQTVITNRVIGPPKAHTVRPAAERRVKQRTKKKEKERDNG